MAIQSNFPAIRPTLDLNFVGTRTVDPRITFTRASTATYFDEFGVMRTVPANSPRIDFDPVTGECKGLLIEEQRTNLLLRSSELNDQVLWIQSGLNGVTPDVALAPDKISNADKVVENSLNTTHSVKQSFSVISGSSYTFSVYLKASERSKVILVLSGAFSANQAIFDLGTGEVSGVTGVTPIITKCLNGWYRCSISANAISTGTSSAMLFLHNNAGPSYLGDGVSGAYAWGAQAEIGNLPSNFIPTTTAQVTRSADSAIMMGANFSSWPNETGTMLAKYKNSGWQHNNTPPSTQLDLAKYIQDYSTSIVSDSIKSVMFYPRQLTESQIAALKG